MQVTACSRWTQAALQHHQHCMALLRHREIGSRSSQAGHAADIYDHTAQATKANLNCCNAATQQLQCLTLTQAAFVPTAKGQAAWLYRCFI